MKLYSDLMPRRGLQLVGDAGLVCWVAAWILLGRALHNATLALAEPGVKIHAAGSQLGDRLRDAGSAIGGIPYVGDDAAAPFKGAGGSADQIAAAGQSQVEAVHSLATWLGVIIAVLPIAIALAIYLPARVRFVLQATAARTLADSAADLDLFALRALTDQPLHVLARISDDPAAGWRQRDPVVIRALAALELQRAGIAVPPLTPEQPG